MRILMVSSFLPYPLLSGGQVRLFNTLKELAPRHDITLVCERRPSQTDDDVRAVERLCRRVVAVPRRKQWSAGNIVRSALGQHSFLFNGHRHTGMQAAVRAEMESADFDVVDVETFYVMQNIPSTTIPIVLVDHNVEHQVYGRYVARAPLPLRPLLALDVAKIKREERAAWRRADVLVAVSAADEQVMKDEGFIPRAIPNGVNIDEFVAKDVTAAVSQEEKRVLFIGDFRWLQNRDSAAFILEQVWPLVSKDRTRDKPMLWIVGRQIPNSIRRLGERADVIFDEEGSARPTPEIFREAYVLLAPIRVGGGSSYKILESMSSGTPVVTMEMSADSFNARDGEHLAVGRTAEELAEQVNRLLEDATLYKRLSTGGRALVEGSFAWPEIAGALDDAYAQACNPARTRISESREI